MSCFIESKKDLSISVFDTEEVENVTLYKIKVQIGNVNWNVVHRYRDFSALHSKLISDHGVPTCKDLLPPKKAIRNKTPKFVEQRKEKLDAYLKQIYSYLELTMPRDFTEFLDFQTYDILFILQNLALKFYHEGDQLLLKPQPYIFTPLELYAISKRLQQPCSQFELVDSKSNFSHVLDFCTQLKALQIEGSEQFVGTSNICPNKLQFDLSPFKSLNQLIMINIPMQNVTNLGTLRETVKILNIHKTGAKKIRDVLLCDVLHKEMDEYEKSMIWKELHEVNFVNNNIDEIDKSIKLVPKLHRLNLSKNSISEIANLSSLPHLTHLNLSENAFTACEDWYSKIGKISSIKLSQNMIQSLSAFSKLYSLESLDISCNQIFDVEEVQNICNLPCLENLRLTANPVASIVDYRVKVIEQFNVRMHDLCLDNEKPSEKELDTARVFQALRIIKEGKTPPFLNSNDQVFATHTAQGGSGL